MKNKFAFLVAGLAIAVPAALSAATYQYVDLQGVAKSIEASSAVEALAIAQAQGNVVMGNEVAVNGSAVIPGTFHGYTFGYVDVNGNYKVVIASSQYAAMELAADKHPRSGVIAIDPVR